MPVQWTLALQIPLLALVIPAAIIIGQWVRGGPLVVSGVGALLAFIVFWSLGTIGEFSGGSGSAYVPRIDVFFGGALLLLGAWAIALAQAAGERRWGWLALLSLAVYLTFAALIALLLSPYSACVFVPEQPYCASADQSAQTLLITGSYIGPVAILLYALRARLPRRATLPAGLHASRLDVAGSKSDTSPESL